MAQQVLPTYRGADAAPVRRARPGAVVAGTDGQANTRGCGTG